MKRTVYDQARELLRERDELRAELARVREQIAAEQEKFRAETVTSAFLAERLRMEHSNLCLYCPRPGTAIWIGPGNVRQWVCERHLKPSTRLHMHAVSSPSAVTPDEPPTIAPNQVRPSDVLIVGARITPDVIDMVRTVEAALVHAAAAVPALPEPDDAASGMGRAIAEAQDRDVRRILGIAPEDGNRPDEQPQRCPHGKTHRHALYKSNPDGSLNYCPGPSGTAAPTEGERLSTNTEDGEPR